MEVHFYPYPLLASALCLYTPGFATVDGSTHHQGDNARFSPGDSTRDCEIPKGLLCLFGVLRVHLSSRNESWSPSFTSL